MQKGSWKTVDWAGYGIAAFVLVGSTLAYFRPDLLRLEDTTGPETYVAPPPQVPGPAVNRWREAAKRVEQDRGQPTGRAARVRVPPQLLHYADKRRFLAIQVAAWREQNYELPHDEAGLARLIRRGELVEVRPVTDDYVLYGVAPTRPPPADALRRAVRPRVTLYRDGRLRRCPRPRRPNRREEGGHRGNAPSSARSPRRHEPAAPPHRRQQGIRARAGVAALQRNITSEAAAYDDYDKRRCSSVSVDDPPGAGQWTSAPAATTSTSGHRRGFRARLLSFIRPEALE